MLIVNPKNKKEIEAVFAGLFEKKLHSRGFVALRLKSEPLTFLKPAADNTVLVAKVLINGWLNRTFYLTAVVGINEPAIAKLFMKAASLN